MGKKHESWLYIKEDKSKPTKIRLKVTKSLKIKKLETNRPEDLLALAVPVAEHAVLDLPRIHLDDGGFLEKTWKLVLEGRFCTNVDIRAKSLFIGRAAAPALSPQGGRPWETDQCQVPTVAAPLISARRPPIGQELGRLLPQRRNRFGES